MFTWFLKRALLLCWKIDSLDKLEEKSCFILEIHYFWNNLLHHSKRRWINYYLQNNKPRENLLGGGVGETIVGAFLLTPWLICITYSRYITLRDTNTVISNITNNSSCNWNIVSTYLPKNLVGLLTQKNSMSQSNSKDNNIFKFWSVVRGIAKFPNWGMAVTMLDEHLCFWTFPIFFLVLH